MGVLALILFITLHIRHLSLGLLFLISGWLTTPVTAQSQTDLGLELKTLVPTLVASPGMCELEFGQSQCVMNTTLIWEAPKAGDFCLKDTKNEQVLNCWENSWSGTFQVEFNSGDSKTFVLIRGRKGTIAANTTITVTGTLEQRMRARRRRGLWRIF